MSALARLRTGRTAPPASLVRLATALLILNLGSAITTVALPVLLVKDYGFGSELAVTVAARLVPMVLAGGVVAWILSKVDARCVAVVSLVATGLTTLLFPVASNVWQINAVSVVNGLTAAGAGPALMAVRSGIITSEQLMSGNGLIAFAERVPQVAGPLIVAAVLAVSTVEVLFVVEAVATVAATALITRLPRVRNESGAPFFSRENAALWFSLLKNRRLQGYVVTGLFYTVAVSAMRMLLIAAASSTFAQNSSALPLLLGSMALGAVVGGLIGFVLPAHATGVVYVLGNALEAVALIGVGLSKSLPLSMALLAVTGIFEAVATTAFFADVQGLLSARNTGPFFALYIPGIDSASVVGTLIGPTLVVSGASVGTFVVAALIVLPLLPYLRPFLHSTPAGPRP